LKTTLNCGGKLLDLSTPRVMGIINTTPDSFYEPSRSQNIDQALRQAEQMLIDGADVLDIGGMSTRPGATLIDPQTEQKRILPLIKSLAERFSEVIISVDTVYATTAQAAVDAGAGIINDVSAGKFDAQLLPTIAQLRVPYVLMHLQGSPDTMQQNPHYPHGVVPTVVQFLADKLAFLRQMGIHDVVIDPGFGFGKTTEHNYQLLKSLSVLQILGQPIMAGISRKGMIWRTLGIDAKQALNGTTVVHTIALLNGATLLRVHDVKEAVEAIKLVELYKNSN
jgi:dihydropteroate synthase